MENSSQSVPNKKYDLFDRTRHYAITVRMFVKQLPKSIATIENSKQLVRSSGSVGANYIEGNDASGKGSRLIHFRISRKVAKESKFWLECLELNTPPYLENTRKELVRESREITLIMNAIINKLSPLQLSTLWNLKFGFWNFSLKCMFPY